MNVSLPTDTTSEFVMMKHPPSCSKSSEGAKTYNPVVILEVTTDTPSFELGAKGN